MIGSIHLASGPRGNNRGREISGWAQRNGVALRSGHCRRSCGVLPGLNGENAFFSRSAPRWGAIMRLTSGDDGGSALCRTDTHPCHMGDAPSDGDDASRAEGRRKSPQAAGPSRNRPAEVVAVEPRPGEGSCHSGRAVHPDQRQGRRCRGPGPASVELPARPVAAWWRRRMRVFLSS